MTILYFGDMDKVSADALGILVKEEVKHFESTKSLDSTDELTLVADTDEARTMIGGKTPKQLAQALSQKIAFKDRPALTDLYLLASEAGNAFPNTSSLAQQLAIEMATLGFNRVVVHAMASPHDERGAYLQIKVETRGLPQLDMPGKTSEKVRSGLIRVKLYTDSYSAQMDRNIADLMHKEQFIKIQPASKKEANAEVLIKCQQALHKARSKRKADPKYQAITVVSDAQYKEVLVQAFNTFNTQGPMGLVSKDVLLSINYLRNALQNIDSIFKDDQMAKDKERIPKYKGKIQETITLLQRNPIVRGKELIKYVETHYPFIKRHSSKFYERIIVPMLKMFDNKKENATPEISQSYLSSPSTSEPEAEERRFNTGVGLLSPTPPTASRRGDLASPPARPPLAPRTPIGARIHIPEPIESAELAPASESEHHTPPSTPSSIRTADIATMSESESSPLRRKTSVASFPPSSTSLKRSPQFFSDDHLRNIRPNDPPLVVNETVRLKRKAFYDDLLAYKSKRMSEWNFNYNYLGIIAAVYYIADMLTGSNLFNSKSGEVKLNTVSKLMTLISTGNEPKFEPSEEDAMQEGRLGQLLSRYGGLVGVRQLVQAAPEPLSKQVSLSR